MDGKKKEQEIQVFGSRLMVSPQARLAFWGYVILFLCIVGMYIVTTGMGWFTPTGIVVGILSLAFLAAYMLVGLYIINCTVTGRCEVLAWVITALVLFSAAVYLTIFIISLVGAAGEKWMAARR